MDESSAKLIEWLKKRPPHSVIKWAADNISVQEQWAVGWVDIRVPEADEANRTNWSWTVISPTDEDNEPESLWQVVVPHDLDIHFVFDSAGGEYAYEIAVLNGASLLPEQESALAEVLSQKVGSERGIEGGWSVDYISTVLEKWSAVYADRSDLKFVWDSTIGESQQLQEAREDAEKIRRGEVATYDLGEGVRASEKAMDFLLNNPDSAAEVMRGIQEVMKKADSSS